MPTATSTWTGDPRLRRFLDAETDAAAIDALDTVLGGEAEHALREAVGRALRDLSGTAAHRDDIVAEARVKLVRKLWSLRAGAAEPVENFLGYVASTGENACYTFLRERFPERTRFRNRVRYAVARHPHTRLTRDAQGTWMCASLAAPAAATDPVAAARFLAEPHQASREWDLDLSHPLPQVVDAVLRRCGGPVPLTRLVDALARVLGEGQFPRHELPFSERQPEPADPTPGIADVLEHRAELTRTWTEIVALPPRQRTALLMNLRDGDGASVLQMLPATGVVAMAGIAAVLELPLAQLEALWPRLPLDDLTLAARLGVTRQQVINLRKSARARLARRLGNTRTAQPSFLKDGHA